MDDMSYPKDHYITPNNPGQCEINGAAWGWEWCDEHRRREK